MGNSWLMTLVKYNNDFINKTNIDKIVAIGESIGFDGCHENPVILFYKKHDRFDFKNYYEALDTKDNIRLKEYFLSKLICYNDYGVYLSFKATKKSHKITLDFSCSSFLKNKDFLMRIIEFYSLISDEIAPDYGYAEDEWSAEFYVDKMRGKSSNFSSYYNKIFNQNFKAMKNNKPVPYLFWCNYFPISYYQNVMNYFDNKIIIKTDIRKNGVLVYLGNNADEAYFATLGKDKRYHYL